MRQLKPDSPEALSNLAWIFSTCPDPTHRNGRLAVAIGTEVCAATNSTNHAALLALAAAYAETGQFEEAAQLLVKAEKLVRIDKTRSEMLESFNKRIPYRE